jgi:hypothetical protein
MLAVQVSNPKGGEVHQSFDSLICGYKPPVIEAGEGVVRSGHVNTIGNFMGRP